MAGFGAGDVEAHHAGIAPPHGQLRDLQAAGGGAHGRQQCVDREAGAGRAEPEALEDRVDHFVEREPLLEVQLGGEADLGVDHAVVGEILGALLRDPHDGVTVLHHADGVGERLEVEHQVVALRAQVEPVGQRTDIGRRQPSVAVLGGQLDDGGGAQAAVEVVVQEGLRSPVDRLV